MVVGLLLWDRITKRADDEETARRDAEARGLLLLLDFTRVRYHVEVHGKRLEVTAATANLIGFRVA